MSCNTGVAHGSLGLKETGYKQMMTDLWVDGSFLYQFRCSSYL